MTARYPSLPYPPPQQGLPSGSIVERAGKILEQEQGRTAGPAGVPQLPEFEQRVRHLREQLQDISDELTRALERLPAMAPAATGGPAVGPLAVGPLAVGPLPAFASPVAHVDGKSLPNLRSAEASPGSIAQTALGLINDGVNPAWVVLRVTSLLNAQGDELPSSLVSFSPNPIHLAPVGVAPVGVAPVGVAPGGVAPVGAQPVQITVHVPNGARPGSYAGLVQAVGLAATRAVLVVDVKPAAGGV